MRNEPTRVQPMQVRERASLSEPQQSEQKTAEWTETINKRKWFDMDRLLRNVAIVGALLVVAAAVRNAGSADVQSVFSSLQTNMAVDWNESLGKLTFVSNLLPESLRTVWSEQPAAEVYAPMTGEIVHAWNITEPYLELSSIVTDVHAAQNGEVMSISHGLDEELIVRLRHENGMETLYGNLAECQVEEGAYIYAGDLLGTVMTGKNLCFEVRQDGRAIDPTSIMTELEALWN